MDRSWRNFLYKWKWIPTKGLAIAKESGCAYIIDPTIRFENDVEQPVKFDEEKKEIYDPCKNYFINKYGLKKTKLLDYVLEPVEQFQNKLYNDLLSSF